MEAIKRPTGERFDQDKKREEMNEEEKAAFDALENSEDGAYEELEDDFLFLVNDVFYYKMHCVGQTHKMLGTSNALKVTLKSHNITLLTHLQVVISLAS